MIFRGKYLYPLPQVDWKAPTVKKNADPYQPTRSKPLNSSVIFGIAVATIVMSSDTCEELLVLVKQQPGRDFTKKILSKRAITMQARRRPSGYCPSTSSSGRASFLRDPSSWSVVSPRSVLDPFSKERRGEGVAVFPTSLSPAKVVDLESMVRINSPIQ